MLDSNELFKKWTKSVMMLAIIFTFLIFFGEIVSSIYLKISSGNEINLKIFYFTAINILILYIGYKIIHMKKISIEKRSIVPLIVIILVSVNYIIFHYNLPVCILSLALPILLSILYSDSKSTKIMALISGSITVIISIILLFINYHLGYNYIINLCMSLIFLMGLTFTSFFMAQLEVGKNELLVASIKERDLYHKKAIIDELTKCYNRSFYVQKINEEFKNCDSLVLGIIDIDYFKKFNDTYGHSIGDEVLKKLGKALNKLNSDEIFTARYGGEEFVILFFNYTLDEARKKIDTLREKFSSKRIEQLNNNVITFSCGLAQMEQHDTPNTLFDKADTVLYEAKNAGRNKTIIYGLDK